MNKKLRHYTKRNLGKNLFNLPIFNLTATVWIIIINVTLFFLFSLLFLINQKYIDYIALRPSFLFEGKYLWTFITSMFMHAGFAHLFFNMFSLFFIGSFVEKIIGKKRFVVFYLFAGLFAGLFFVLLSGFFGSSSLGSKIFGDPNIPGLGASGAIFGLLGILAFLTPKAKVYLIIGPLIAIVFQFIIQNNFSTNFFAGILLFLIQIYFIISLFAVFSFNSRLSKIALPLQISFWMLPFIAIAPLVIIGLFVELPIGNMAHFGGFIAGTVYGIYLKIKYSNKVKLLNKYMGN